MECRTYNGCEWLAKCQHSVYSQFGEDGLVRTIFDRIGVGSCWCMEVGAADGVYLSNTRTLLEQDWDGVLIEADPGLFTRLQQNAQPFQAVCVNQEIAVYGRASLDAILAAAGAPERMDLMSLDIDGSEAEIWSAMRTHSTRVMVCEVYHAGDTESEVLAAAALHNHVPLVRTQSNLVTVERTEFQRLAA